MEREVAEVLIDGLENHPEIIPPDRSLFMNTLTSTKVPASSRFYVELPDTQQIVQDAERHHYLSLRRVLRNRNAEKRQQSLLKQTYEVLAALVGVYSSDILARRLREDKGLVDMMARSRHPFSLLGKFQTYDLVSPAVLFIVTRPVLVIPDAEDVSKILAWERANTTYEKESGFLFRHTKRVQAQEYFAH